MVYKMGWGGGGRDVVGVRHSATSWCRRICRYDVINLKKKGEKKDKARLFVSVLMVFSNALGAHTFTWIVLQVRHNNNKIYKYIFFRFCFNICLLVQPPPQRAPFCTLTVITRDDAFLSYFFSNIPHQHATSSQPHSPTSHLLHSPRRRLDIPYHMPTNHLQLLISPLTLLTFYAQPRLLCRRSCLYHRASSLPLKYLHTSCVILSSSHKIHFTSFMCKLFSQKIHSSYRINLALHSPGIRILKSRANALKT